MFDYINLNFIKRWWRWW